MTFSMYGDMTKPYIEPTGDEVKTSYTDPSLKVVTTMLSVVDLKV